MNKTVTLFAIYDRVSKIYSAPLCFENEDCAKRYFSTLLVNNPNKADYELVYLCAYSISKGSLLIGDDEFLPDLIMKGSEIDG